MLAKARCRAGQHPPNADLQYGSVTSPSVALGSNARHVARIALRRSGHSISRRPCSSDPLGPRRRPYGLAAARPHAVLYAALCFFRRFAHGRPRGAITLTYHRIERHPGRVAFLVAGREKAAVLRASAPSYSAPPSSRLSAARASCLCSSTRVPPGIIVIPHGLLSGLTLSSRPPSCLPSSSSVGSFVPRGPWPDPLPAPHWIHVDGHDGRFVPNITILAFLSCMRRIPPRDGEAAQRASDDREPESHPRCVRPRQAPIIC